MIAYLSSHTVCEHFGVAIPDVCTPATATAALARPLRVGTVKLQDLTGLHSEVWAACCALDEEISSGALTRAPRLVHGRPLSDWVSLDDVTRLLRDGGTRR